MSPSSAARKGLNIQFGPLMIYILENQSLKGFLFTILVPLKEGSRREPQPVSQSRHGREAREQGRN